jgi:hypothetical protein
MRPLNPSSLSHARDRSTTSTHLRAFSAITLSLTGHVILHARAETPNVKRQSHEGVVLLSKQNPLPPSSSARGKKAARMHATRTARLQVRASATVVRTTLQTTGARATRGAKQPRRCAAAANRARTPTQHARSIDRQPDPKTHHLAPPTKQQQSKPQAAAPKTTSQNTCRVAVLGASGYTGAEVVRLAALHPNLDIVALTGEKQAGKPFAEVFPHLGAGTDASLVKIADVDFSSVDAAFCCLPHATTQAIIKELPSHVKVVDLSADFRLADVDVYAEW